MKRPNINFHWNEQNIQNHFFDPVIQYGQNLRGKKKIEADSLLISMKMAYYCTLQKDELTELKIKQVFDKQNKALNSFTFNNRQIIIPGSLQADLENFFKNLCNERCSTTRNSFLFPREKTSKALEKNWTRINKQIFGRYPFCYKPLRLYGMIRYFDQLPSNLSREKRIKTTAECFGRTEKWIELLMQGRP